MAKELSLGRGYHGDNGAIVNGNGTWALTQKLIFWIMGVMLALVGGLGLFTINGLNERLNGAEHTASQNSIRIASVEADLRNIKETVQRIDQKMDRLLEANRAGK